MNLVYLFLLAGAFIVYLIIQYDKQNKKKVDDILRANKNVPPLFMIRSAEQKVNAIKAVLNSPNAPFSDQADQKKKIATQLQKLTDGYKNREITLAAYYAKLGALLITANDLKGNLVMAEKQTA
jgi:hypothetical protein